MAKTSPAGSTFTTPDEAAMEFFTALSDALVASMPQDGNQYIAGGVIATPKFLAIDHASNGDNTLLAGVPGFKIRVINIVLVATGTVNVRFESGAGGTALTGVINLVANTGFAPGEARYGHFETAAGQLLNLELSAGTSVDGWLTYVLVAG